MLADVSFLMLVVSASLSIFLLIVEKMKAKFQKDTKICMTKKLIFDKTLFVNDNIHLLQEKVFVEHFPHTEKLEYYARTDIKQKTPLMYKLKKPITTLVDFMNSKQTAAKKFTLIKNVPDSYYYWGDKVISKFKGLFEYKFNRFTTIDSILDN